MSQQEFLEKQGVTTLRRSRSLLSSRSSRRDSRWFGAAVFRALLFAMVAALVAGSAVVPAEDYWITTAPIERGPLAVEAVPSFDPAGRPLAGMIVTLDAGHGGSTFDRGYAGSARGTKSRVVEGDRNMLVAARLRHLLVGAGAEVHMTRWDDRRVTLNPEDPAAPGTNRDAELGARVDLAEATASHLFLALHHNSTSRETADGVVVLIWPTDLAGNEQPLERALADALREAVEKRVHHNEPFPHYISDHPLVHNSDMPSAVVEFGFLSNPEFDAWVSQPGSQNDEARGVYEGLTTYWAAHAEELEALRRQLFPDAEPIDVAAVRAEAEATADPRPAQQADAEDFVGAADQAARAGDFIRSLVADKAALPLTDAAQVQHYIDLYKQIRLSDKTAFRFDVKVRNEAGRWSVEGAVNHPLLRHAGAAMVAGLVGAEVDDQVRLLPAESLGAKKFGVIQIPMAMTWRYPEEGRSVETQVLLGEPVYLLDVNEAGTYYLIHAADSYIGWVRREAVRRMDAAEFTAWGDQPMARVVNDYLLDDFRLPAGGLLPVVKWNEEVAVVRLPMLVRAAGDSTEIEVPLANLRLPASERPGDIAARAASEYLYTPYVFGGRSRLGLDCSGLTGVAWAAAGVTLPRDANQEVRTGRLVATPWYLDGLRPGDALFFIDSTGGLVHAGISIGGARFIHASPPEVNISSLDPDDPLYTAAWSTAFAFARRPME